MKLQGVLIPEETLLKIVNKEKLKEALQRRGTMSLTPREQFDKLIVDCALSRNNPSQNRDNKSLPKGAL